MSVNITIRNVPDDVRDGLAERAAESGQSMQEYLVRELTTIASRPSPAEVIRRAREHAETLPPLRIEEILEALDADRRG